jgi:eukaryotic-like serine/threonine-protein kinase
MATVFADRNLLVGILALQHGLIDRDTLVEAMQDWLLDREQPLERFIRDRGRLNPEEELLLEALVATHLKRHGDGPGPGSARKVLGRIAETDLPGTRSWATTWGRDESSEARLAGPGPSVGCPSTSGLRFHVVRHHARGGLGEVFLATDSELNRTVALKRLREGHADNPRSQARFLVEAEVTGGLEHPGIVPVYGLGADADGRPFYAMRFIRGATLKEAIRRFHEVDREPGRDPAQRSLELRQLLGRFIDVCDAMAYAHSRGVLHRDLKPDNILLGKYGETLVVDWGLAKAMGRRGTDPSTDPDDEEVLRLSSDDRLVETVVGSIVGTPEFMSPEQAWGDPSRLGPAMDVYSLGATLYSLLTGRPPFREGDTPRLLAKVGRGEFPRPRAINPEVPAALEAICLKAMSLSPGERYPTTRLLAQDVERWLADEPVSALREPWPERARRWARRHRSLMAGVATALIVAVLALGGILAREAQSNRQLRLANLRETRAREQSQARFRLARDAVAGYYSGISEEVLLKRTEFNDLRRSLLTSAMNFYKDLAASLEADQEFDPSARLDLARAEKAISQITRQIASSAAALEAARRAQVHFARLIEERPAEPGLRRELAETLALIGHLQGETGHPAEALKAHQESLEIRRELARIRPDGVDDRFLLARTQDDIGKSLEDLGRRPEALQSYRAALALHDALLSEQPGNDRFETERARAQNDIGEVLARTGHFDEAFQACEKSRAIRERLAAAHPADEVLQEDLAGSLTTLGMIQAHIGRPAEALESFRRSAFINQKLVAAHPNSTSLRRYLANNYNDIGGVHGQVNRMEEALQAYQRARAIQEVLVASNPDVLQYQNDLATSLANIAIIKARLDRADEALPLFAQSLALRRKLSAANPSDTYALSKLAWTHYSIGVLHAQNGREEQALGPFEQARQLRQSLVDAHPDLIEPRSELAESLESLGLLTTDLGRPAEAMGWLERARAALLELARLEPTITRHRRAIARTWIWIGLAHRGADRDAEALTSQEQARELLQVLVRDDPEDFDSRGLLGQSWKESGSALAHLGRHEESVHAFREAVREYRVAFDRAPGVIAYRENLSNAHASLSESLLALGRPADAAASALEIRELCPRDGDRLFEAACLLAACAQAVAAGNSPGQRGGTEPSQRLRYDDAAMETLRQAVAAGFRDAHRLSMEAAFTSLRPRPDFHALVMDLAFPSDPFR